MLLFLFLTDIAHLKALYKCLEMDVVEITVYLLYPFLKG